MSRFGLVDDVIPEPLGGAHAFPETMAQTLKQYLVNSIAELSKKSYEERINQRIEKLSKMGFYEEVDA